MSKLMVNTNNNDVALALTNRLKTIIKENSEIEQCLAVQSLGFFASEQVLSILMEQLRNPDEDVRCDAGKALAILQDKGAIPLLIENLKQDPVGEAKVIYIEALEALNAYESAGILCQLTSSRVEEEVAWEEDGSDWDDWLDVQRAAIKALGCFANEIDKDIAIKAILSALHDPEGQDLWALSVNSLVQFGDAGVKALIDLMSDSSALNRKRIIMALSNSKVEQSETLIKAAMADPDVTVRLAAIITGAKKGMNDICDLGLEDGSSDVRAKTLLEFDNLDDKILSRALKDISPKVQIAACKAIIKDNKIRPKLKLVNKAQTLLRKDADELVSALIEAISIANPSDGAEFIEDIVNHSATSSKVRIASLKALGELKSKNSVALLSRAAGDDNFEIRTCAIGALGKIAKDDGGLANKAVEVLSSAIAGNLVKTPKDWQPEDNVIDFDRKKQKRSEENQDSRKVRLDREGNIIEVSNQPEIEQTIETEIEEITKEPAPVSTLDAIMAANSSVPTIEDNIKFDEADIEFLEMTGKGAKKRKRLSPINSTPAHIDVRRLAALVGSQTGRAELVEPLIIALSDDDKGLNEAALDAITVLAGKNIDISPAQRNLLRHATTSETNLSLRAIRALAFIKASVVTKVLAKLSKSDDDTIRSEAIRASKGRDIEIDLGDLCVNAKRQTRIAAAELIALCNSEKAVPALMSFAFVEDGVHKKMAAELLKNHQQKAFEVVQNLLDSKEARKRLIGLNILNVMMQANSSKA